VTAASDLDAGEAERELIRQQIAHLRRYDPASYVRAVADLVRNESTSSRPNDAAPAL
jgi:hypothetical protein